MTSFATDSYANAQQHAPLTATTFESTNFPFDAITIGKPNKEKKGWSVPVSLNIPTGNGGVFRQHIRFEVSGRLNFSVLGGKYGPQASMSPNEPEFFQKLHNTIVKKLFESPARDILWPPRSNSTRKALTMGEVAFQVKEMLKRGNEKKATAKYTPAPGEYYDDTISGGLLDGCQGSGVYGDAIPLSQFERGSKVTVCYVIGNLWAATGSQVSIPIKAGLLRLNTGYPAASSMTFATKVDPTTGNIVNRNQPSMGMGMGMGGGHQRKRPEMAGMGAVEHETSHSFSSSASSSWEAETPKVVENPASAVGVGAGVAAGSDIMTPPVTA